MHWRTGLAANLVAALATLKGEGRRDDCHSQDAHCLGGRSYYWRRATARPTAHARLFFEGI